MVHQYKVFFISSSAEELEDEWLEGAKQMNTVTVSWSSKNYKYLDDNEQIIAGKSDTNIDVFDTIIFADWKFFFKKSNNSQFYQIKCFWTL